MSYRFVRQREGKYNIRKVTIDGIRFDSPSEGEYYEHLKLMKHVGKIESFELQPKIYMTDAKILYKPDFQIVQDGVTIFIDVKGIQTPVFKLKMRLWKHYGLGTLRLVKKTRHGFELVREITTTVGRAVEQGTGDDDDTGASEQL